MAYSDDIVSSPVSVADIAAALGVESQDVKTLCQHANINKWAKNKPFRLNKNSAVTVQERIDANYGLNFVVTESEAGYDIVGAVMRAATDTDCFAYDTVTTGYLAQGKPRGPEYGEGFRILDFDGYHHSIPPPIQGLSENERNINRALYDNWITLSIYAADAGAAYQMSVGDVIGAIKTRMGIDLSEWHIVIAIQYNGTGGFFAVSDEAIGQDGRRFTFNIRKSQLVDGNPKYYIAGISDKDAGYYSKVAGLPFLRADIEGYGYGTLNVYTQNTNL